MIETESPEEIRDVEELEEILSRPYPETMRVLEKIDGDFIVLGAGGKIGPSLVEMLARAYEKIDPSRRIYAVSRFSRRDVVNKLKRYRNIEIIESDLSNRESVERLPEAKNIIYMVGRKFGTEEDPGLTWITNVYIPALVAERFRESRFIIYSTGNVYPLVEVSSGGATEETQPEPVGEYGWSALARERIMSYFIKKNNSSGVIVRLNYACELRYGVLVDIALKVYRGEEIDLSMGYVNVVWQGDANNYVLRLLKHVSNPPLIINLTGPEIVSVKWVAEEFGKRFNRKPLFKGRAEETALLSNASKLFRLLGYPRVSLLQMIDWISMWISQNKPIYNLPTHYEVRTGRF
ncbi:MAG: NAD(P)-dependent oxidoreductase [Sulfolobales archaeon]